MTCGARSAILPLSLVFALAGLTDVAFAASSAECIAEGNRAYGAGKYDEALAAYDKASVEAPESACVYFDKGTALYMKKDYAKAREMFEKAALKSKALGLEARSQYNLGNCAYRESERQRDSDLQKCLKQMQQAVAHYQKALELDPKLIDAAHNIEVTRLKMKQIMDEIKKQQEAAKKKQAQQKQQAEALKQLLKKQEKVAQDAKALADKKQKEMKREDLEQASKDLAAKQDALRKETQNAASRMQPPKGQPAPPQAKAQEHLQRAASEQKNAKEQLDQQNPEPAAGDAAKAADEIRKALASMSGPPKGGGEQKKDEKHKKKAKGTQGKPSPQKNPPAPNKPQRRPSAMQRDEDAHRILNEEQEDREKRQLPVAGGYRPVDKDW